MLINSCVLIVPVDVRVCVYSGGGVGGAMARVCTLQLCSIFLPVSQGCERA